MAKAKKSAEKDATIKQVFYDVITRPVITEKATMLSEHNKVVFRVLPDATKTQVKQAVEALFKVKVTRVNTLITEGKQKAFRNRLGKREDFKKAIVTLEKGQSIDLSSGAA
jgi:large subunit ribosomal protein L23